jgi:hypothetical protein
MAFRVSPEDFRNCGACVGCGVAIQYDNHMLNAFGQTLFSRGLPDGTRDIRCSTGECHEPTADWFERYVLRKATEIQ